MSLARCTLLSLCALAFSVQTGCSGGGPPAPKRASVRGLVSWEGQPIQEGTITFVPVGDTKGSPTAATIREGQYTLNSTMGPSVGPNRVEIIANRSTGQKVPAVPPGTGEIEKIEQYIPPKFNRSSMLEREIEPGGNKLDFELTAK